MESKSVLITGATRGLGRSLSVWADAKGYTVYGCGRGKAEVDALQRDLGRPHQFEVVDVTDAAAVQAWVDRMYSGGAGPYRVLNNAAVVNATAPLWQVTEAEFDSVIDINIKGVQNVIRAVVPYLERQGGGVIVNFSSGWGRSVDAGVAPYCATKWAIEGLTAALALDLPAGIAAYALNPGVIDTRMLRSCFGAGAESCPKPEQWVKTAAPFIFSLPNRQGKVAVTAP